MVLVPETRYHVKDLCPRGVCGYVGDDDGLYFTCEGSRNLDGHPLTIITGVGMIVVLVTRDRTRDSSQMGLGGVV